MAEFLRSIGLLRGRVVGRANIIRSLPGCHRQPWHRDYNTTVMATAVARGLPKPLSVILALQNGARLDIFSHPGSVEMGP